MAKILVCDPLAQEGIEILKRAGEVVEAHGMSEDELCEAVRDADAVVVRSGTKITARVIDAAQRLRVIARAGVGVDNIDVEAATKKGIVVVNSPAGNTLAAAEHTIALLMAAARNIPQANMAMRSGKWDRKKFMGRQVAGKRLGLIGFGRIGSEVCKRAVALGMDVVAYDPYVPGERMRALGAEPMELDELLSTSDFVSLHAVLKPETRGMIGERELRLMKPDAILINCARGELVDEEALLRALKEGWIGGAALDVFADDKNPNPELINLPNVVATPHLGASTEEAQAQVAIDAAEQVVDVLEGRAPRFAINAPALPPEAQERLRGYVRLAQVLGRLLGKLLPRAAGTLRVSADGELSMEQIAFLARYAVAEFLRSGAGVEGVNYVNALLVAKERGIDVDIARRELPLGYKAWLAIDAGDHGEQVVGALMAEDQPLIVRVGGFPIDFAPRGRVIFIWHGQPGKPGFVGRIGTLLGNANINIEGIEIARREIEGKGLMVVTVREPVSDELLSQIKSMDGVVNTILVEFGD